MSRDRNLKYLIVLLCLFARCFYSYDAFTVFAAHQCLASSEDFACRSAGVFQSLTKHQESNCIDDIMKDLSPYGLIRPLGKREQLQVFFAGLEDNFDICPAKVLRQQFLRSQVTV